MKLVEKNNELYFELDEDTKKSLETIMFFKFDKSKGDSISKGDKLLTVETMKNTYEIESPGNYVIEEINTNLENDPDILKEKPDTWLIKVKT